MIVVKSQIASENAQYKLVIIIILKKVIIFEIMIFGKVGNFMKRKEVIPNHHQMTEFLRGQASRIFDEVAKNDEVVLVNKNSKPQNIIISYERYCRLKEKGADI